MASSSVAAGMGLAGCTEIIDSVEERVSGDDGPSCEGIELETGSARPGNWVTVDGLNERWGEEPLVWFHDAAIDDPDDEDWYPTFLDRTDDGDVRLFVPIHPTGEIDGGPIELEFESEDADVVCSGFDLEVAALDPAPGELDAMADAVEDVLVATAERYGYDATELRATDVEDLPQQAFGVATALQAMDDGDLPGFRTLLEPDDPVSGADPEEENRELVEAILAETGALDHLESMSQEMTTGGPGALGAKGTRGAVTSSPQGNWVGAPGRTVTATSPSGDVPDPDEVETPEELDRWMNEQAAIDEIINSPEWDTAEFGLGIAGLFPPTSVPAGKAAAYFTALGVGYEILAGALPSDLEMSIDMEPTTYPEDDPETQESHEWNAELAGINDPVTVDTSIINENIPHTKILSKFRQGRRGSGSDSDEMADVLPGGEDVLEYVEDKLKEVLDLPAVAEHEFPSNEWGPVVVDPDRDDEEEFFRWELTAESQETDTEPFRLLEDDEGRYEPEAVGQSELLIQSEPGTFADAHASADETLRVDPIEIEIQNEDGAPQDIFHADADEEDPIERSLVAWVENAVNRDVKWDMETQEGPDVGPLDTEGEDNEVAHFHAPADAFEDVDRAVYRIEVESTADTGLRRKEDAPQRMASAHVIVSDDPEEAELAVSSIDCVPTYTTYQFQAWYGNTEIDPFSDLDWWVDGPGSLAADGTFTPQGPGDVTIEFEYDPEDVDTVTEEVSFEVREDCRELSMTPLQPHRISDRLPVDQTAECVWMRFSDSESPRFIVRVPEKDDKEIGDLRSISFPFRVRHDAVDDEMDGDPLSGEWDVHSPKREPLEQAVVRHESVEVYVMEAADVPDTEPFPYPALVWPCLPEDGGQLAEVSLRRREVEIDGETVGVYEGHFEGPVSRGSGTSPVNCGLLRIDFFGLRMEDETDCER